MDEPFTIGRVQALRRLTRVVGDTLRDQVSAYLSTLGILFRPARVLGQYVQGSEKEAVKGADRAFRDMQALYEKVARARPFTLTRELRGPIDVTSVTLELHPVEYPYDVHAGGETRTVTVRSPLTWTLSYAGYGPGALPDLLAHRTGANDELHDWIVHQLLLHAVVSNQPGLCDILDRLHFPVSFATEPASGLLPLTRISSPLTTLRPDDEVIMQSAELSGMDAFEEVINVDDIARITDPLKGRLVDIATSHGQMQAAV